MAVITSLVVMPGPSAAQDADEPPSGPPPTEPAPPPVSPEEPPPEPEAPEPTTLPDARELIEQSRAACGQPDKIAALKFVAIKATLALPTGENDFDVTSARRGAFRFEQRSHEHPGVVVHFDGSVGWIVHSDLRYELIDDFTLERGQHQFNAMFPLWLVLFPEEHFHSSQTIEQTIFNERECYRVQLNDEKASKIQRFAYFDVEEKFMRGMSVTQDTTNGPVSVQFRFEEWKDVDEIKVFTRVDIVQPNQPLVLNYTRVEFNTVDEAMFEQPAEVKEMVRVRETPPPMVPPANTSPDAEDADHQLP